MRKFALAAIGIIAMASIGGTIGSAIGGANDGGAVLGVLVAIMLIVTLPALALWIWLGGLPGRIAHARRHANADAIRLCGFVGMVFPVAWIVAIVWAHTEGISIVAKATTEQPLKAVNDVPCPQCGTACPAPARFCGGCGAAVAVEKSWRSLK